MANYVTVLSAHFLLYLVSNGLAARDDICLTPEKQAGKCIALGECPYLLNLLKKRPIPPQNEQLLKESTCGFQGVHPKVCCPLNVTDAIPPQPVTTTAESLLPEPPLSGLLPDLDECGQFSEDRIIPGDETQLDGYPWTVLLEYETPNGNGFHCGGVLINKRYVLTAAHCIHLKENWKLVNVRLGEYDRSKEQDCDSNSFLQIDSLCTDEAVNLGIQEKIVHEDYDPNNKYQHNDIALLRLAENVVFTEFVRPICLQPVQQLKEVSVSGKAGTISGWGISKLTSNSNKKQWSRMLIKDNVECESAYAKKELRLREDQICAFAAAGKTSCTQDSGGALMNDVHDPSSNHHHFAVGLMSFGYPVCGLSEYPVIYTKVEKYIPWIVEKLQQ